MAAARASRFGPGANPMHGRDSHGLARVLPVRREASLQGTAQDGISYTVSIAPQEGASVGKSRLLDEAVEKHSTSISIVAAFT